MHAQRMSAPGVASACMGARVAAHGAPGQMQRVKCNRRVLGRTARSMCAKCGKLLLVTSHAAPRIRKGSGARLNWQSAAVNPSCLDLVDVSDGLVKLNRRLGRCTGCRRLLDGLRRTRGVGAAAISRQSAGLHAPCMRQVWSGPTAGSRRNRRHPRTGGCHDCTLGCTSSIRIS